MEGSAVGSPLEIGHSGGLDDGSMQQSSVASTGVITEFEAQLFSVTDAYHKAIHSKYEKMGGVGAPPRHHFDDYDSHPSLLEKMGPSAHFPAHLDSATVLVPMHEHGCFVTASHDGFHRVWNLDKACLGEMPLPNLTDRLKIPKEPIVGTLGTTEETDMKHWSRPAPVEPSHRGGAGGEHAHGPLHRGRPRAGHAVLS